MPARLLVALLLLFGVVGRAAVQDGPPVFVTLWFDTEDYILPQDDDAAKRLAEMLTALGVRATFKVVGEKARVLEQRGRKDVIAALRRHDIGYHSNTHSQQPTIAVYLQHAGWEDGREEFTRRESSGARDVARIFGTPPVAYGQPGSAWAPQAYPALRDMHIGLYLDEADHVGIDDQPFYYGGLLNVFKMRSNLVRMDLKGGDSLTKGQAAFTTAYERLRAKGGGTISIYYHPNEWVHTEFWDAVNFSHGANPARTEWKQPGVRPAAETEHAFRDFDAFVRFMKARPGVRFVTATDLMRIYADGAMVRSFGREDVARLAQKAQNEITFERQEGYTLSASDTFGLLNAAMAAFIEKRAWPEGLKIAALDGPPRPYAASAGGARPTRIPWPAFAQAVGDVDGYLRTLHRMPPEVWVGSHSVSPADYLATLASAVESSMAHGDPPADVTLRSGRFTADRYVAEDSPDLWGWVIFPDGFHAPAIMELARLQAWTLKPAVFQR